MNLASDCRGAPIVQTALGLSNLSTTGDGPNAVSAGAVRDGFGGSVVATGAFNGDAYTVTLANPNFANLDLRCASVDVADVDGPARIQYFPGLAPAVPPPATKPGTVKPVAGALTTHRCGVAHYSKRDALYGRPFRIIRTLGAGCTRNRLMLVANHWATSGNHAARIGTSRFQARGVSCFVVNTHHVFGRVAEWFNSGRGRCTDGKNRVWFIGLLS